MFSKSMVVRGLTLFAVGWAVGACNLNLHDSPPNSPSIDAKLGFDTSCLSSTGSVVGGFVNGTATSNDIATTFDCLNGSLQLFERKVKGARSDGYSPQELANFFQDYYFKNTVLTPTFVAQVMLVKQVLVGGTTDLVTHTELHSLESFLQDARGQCLDLLPFMPVYSLNWKPRGGDQNSYDSQFFANSDLQLQTVAKFLTSRFALNASNYDLQNLTTLGHEINKIWPAADGATNWGALADQYVPILLAGKKIVNADTTTTISQDKWPFFLSTAASIYTRYLDYYYFIKPASSWQVGDGLVHANSLVTKALDLVDAVINNRPAGHPIAFTEIGDLANSFVVAKVLPDWLTPTVVDPLIQVLFQKILLTPADRLAGKLPGAVTTEATQVVRDQLASWVEAQNFNQSAFTTSTSLNGPQLITLLDAGAPSRTLTELRMSLVSPVPLALDAGGRLFFSPKTQINYDLEALNTLNLARMIVRVVLDAYVGDATRLANDQGINNDEANALFKDLKPVAVQAGMIQPDDTSFANSRFREANLFTPHADGDTYLNFAEGVDIASLIISGLKLGDSMYDAFMTSCPVFKDSAGQERITERCFLTVYRQQIPTVFTSMPEFVRQGMAQASKLSPNGAGPVADAEIGKFERMLLDFLTAAGWIDDKSGLIRTGDLALIPHVVQYIEVIMTKYDADQNGFIDRDEAMRAYPLFHGILYTAMDAYTNHDSEFLTESVLRGAFAYMLVYGQMPQGFAAEFEFLGLWVPQYTTWPIWADRKQLGHVLSSIQSLLTPASAASKPPVSIAAPDSEPASDSTSTVPSLLAAP